MFVRFEVVDGEEVYRDRVDVPKGFKAYFIYLCIKGLLSMLYEDKQQGPVDGKSKGFC